jgi:hypothetical protein
MARTYTRVTEDNVVDNEDEVQVQVGELVTQVSVTSKGDLKNRIAVCSQLITQKVKEKASLEAELLDMDEEVKKVLLKRPQVAEPIR